MLIMKNHRMNNQNTKNAITTTATTVVSSVVGATSIDTASTGIPPNVIKKDRPLLSISIPSYVSKLEDTKAGGRFFCGPCQAHCNSDIQLSQHLASRKHMEKLSRKMGSSNGDMGETCSITEVTGRSPNKANMGYSFCHICKLSFPSQGVMDMHLNGSKHQRKLKCIELVKSLEGKEPGFKFDTITGDVVCTLCSVTFYSPQHITRHVEGEKHMTAKGKRENGEEGGTPAKKHCSSACNQDANQSGQSNANYEMSEGSAITTITSNSRSMTPTMKERPLLNLNVPPCVTKIEDTRCGGKFLCNPCQAHCNSDIQLSQHLASKKHLDKVSGKRNRGFGCGWKGNAYTQGSGRASTQDACGTQNLASVPCVSSYNSGGYDHQSTAYPETRHSPHYKPTSGPTANYAASYGRPVDPNKGGHPGSGGREAYISPEAYGGYGPCASAYGQSVDPYSDYGSSDFAAGRGEAVSECGSGFDQQGYGATGQNLAHFGARGMSFTYTQPISPSFVSGGTIY